jgi:hypothetical protein
MHHQTQQGTRPARPVAIEVDGEPIGVVVPAGDGVRFLAVRLSAFSLDGSEFDSIESAQLAIGATVRRAPKSASR